LSLNKWQWSDAWVLASIISSDYKHVFSLRDIIASGDYINHSIFIYDELAHGLAKLESIGFITQQNYNYLITDKFLNEFNDMLEKYKNVLKLCDNMFKRLSVITLDENQLNEVVIIHKSAYEKACKEYLEN